jgi:hypothetical protein
MSRASAVARNHIVLQNGGRITNPNVAGTRLHTPSPFAAMTWSSYARASRFVYSLNG